jgi:hypothetical protein
LWISEQAVDAVPGVAFVSLGIDPWLAALLDDAIEGEVLKAIEVQVLKKPTNTFNFLSRLRTSFELSGVGMKQSPTYVSYAKEITEAFKNDGDIQKTIQKFHKMMDDQQRKTVSRRDPTLDSLRDTFDAAFEKTRWGKWVVKEPPTHYELFVKQHMQVESKEGIIGLQMFKLHFHAWVKHMLQVVVEAHTYNMPVKMAGNRDYETVEDIDDEAERLAYVKRNAFRN